MGMTAVKARPVKVTHLPEQPQTPPFGSMRWQNSLKTLASVAEGLAATVARFSVTTSSEHLTNASTPIETQ